MQEVCSHSGVLELLVEVLLNFPESVELLEITLVTLSQLVFVEGQSTLPGHLQLLFYSCILYIKRPTMRIPDFHT